MEILCATIEEVDALLERYGSDNGGDGDEPSATPRRASSTAHAPDMALLRAFVAAGATGVETKKIEGMLGARGKALRGALQRWGSRVGLTGTDGFPCDNARPGGRRGWKLADGTADVARLMIEPKG